MGEEAWVIGFLHSYTGRLSAAKLLNRCAEWEACDDAEGNIVLQESNREVAAEQAGIAALITRDRGEVLPDF